VKGQGGSHRHVPVSIDIDGGGTTIGRSRACLRDHQATGASAASAPPAVQRPPLHRAGRAHGLWLRVEHNGLRIEAQVMSARAAELLRAMPFKAPPDMSKFLLSPMPGLLVDIAVQPGQKVQAGERLAVIEAMKMENILTAVAGRHVAELLAGKGESLAVDQPILSFA
jgi:propionyl-CoA carboxylase alpha chain